MSEVKIDLEVLESTIAVYRDSIEEINAAIRQADQAMVTLRSSDWLDGMENNIKDMKSGLEQCAEAVKKINDAVDDSPNNWEGAAQTAYMEQYNTLRSAMTKDVPDAVEGMIDFLENFLNDMIERDRDAASSLRG